MKEIFKQLIIDFHNQLLPQPIHRDLDIPKLPANVKKALVLVGMRRSGKTWCLYQYMHHLLENNTPFKNILYLNFEDDRLINLKGQGLQFILHAYFELYPELIKQKNIYLFLDEIHEVPNWQKFIRRILDTEEINLFITGSSAKMLSKEIASSLRGRTIVREIFPLSFAELLQANQNNQANNISINNSENLSNKQQSLLLHKFNNFLSYGGFPEVINLDETLHREILQSYINTVIHRDIVERYNIANITALKQLIIFCLKNSSALVSINKLYNSFKSQGIAVSKNSLYQYIDYLADAYCIFSINIYSFSLKNANLKPKKIYAVDTGLIHAYTIKHNFEHAASFETAVFMQLRRKYSEIFYFHTQSGKEIDFLIVLPTGELLLFQAAINIQDNSTYNREISALTEAMAELDIKHSTLVTIETTDNIATRHGVIDVVPCWRCFLEV